METAIGLGLIALVCYPVWSPRMRRIRNMNRLLQRAEDRVGPLVSGNVEKVLEAKGVDPRVIHDDWEQDEVFPEVFEEEEDV